MKVVRDNIIYVQRSDILMICLTDNVPESIIYSQFGKGVVKTDSTNINDFIKFEKENEIEFFKQADWIIDYDELKELSDDEIDNFINNIYKEIKELRIKYASLDDFEKITNRDIIFRSKLLEYKTESLEKLKFSNRKSLENSLPEECKTPQYVLK